MAASPSFASTPIADAVAISTANTNRDGTGTLGTLHTAGNGSRIDLIRIVAVGSTSQGVVRIFYDDGSTVFLLHEILVDPITPSTVREVFMAEWIPTVPLLVKGGDLLKVSTHIGEGFNVFAIGGGF
jgi:hypothetical protein